MQNVVVHSTSYHWSVCLVEQTAEVRKMANASGGDDVKGQGKKKNASAPVF